MSQMRETSKSKSVGRWVLMFFVGVIGFAVGYYASLIAIISEAGIGGPLETPLEVASVVLGTALSVLAVSVASGRFRRVVRRVLVVGGLAGLAALAFLLPTNTDVTAMVVVGLGVVVAETLAARSLP